MGVQEARGGGALDEPAREAGSQRSTSGSLSAAGGGPRWRRLRNWPWGRGAPLRRWPRPRGLRWEGREGVGGHLELDQDLGVTEVFSCGLKVADRASEENWDWVEVVPTNPRAFALRVSDASWSPSSRRRTSSCSTPPAGPPPGASWWCPTVGTRPC